MQRRAVILMAAAALLAACKEEVEVQAPAVRPVRTLTVERVRADDGRAAVGAIRPERDIDLSFRVSGKVFQRVVDVGDTFTAGALIGRVDPEDYLQRLKSAQGDLAAASAVLVEAKAQEARTAKLFDDGFATRTQMDGAVKSLHSAEAKLKSAQASLKLAEAQLAYTELRAEFDGIVTATGVEEGQVLNAGQLVVRVAEPRVRDAVFDVAEAAFFGTAAGAGTPVRVSLLGHPEISTVGSIREVSPVADSATGTWRVRVGLTDAPEAMRFGTSVSGKLDIEAPEVMLLPLSALFDRAGEPAVWVVDPAASQVSLQPIEVARYEANGIVVGSGLTEGDIVVAAGVHKLRENEKVRLSERNHE
jgi:RND family efflux transporter MFP subunit